MKNTFIKITGYPEWFLYLKSSEKIIDQNCDNRNYDDIASKYGHVLIRKSGSFMTLLNEHKIIESVQKNTFPN